MEELVHLSQSGQVALWAMSYNPKDVEELTFVETICQIHGCVYFLMVIVH